MNRKLKAFITFTAAACCADAFAAIDQEFAPSIMPSRGNVGTSGTRDWAQTFSVSKTGLFTGFDLFVSRNPSTTLPLLYDIRITVGGVPTGPDSGSNILVSGSLDATIFGITTISVSKIVPHVDLDALAFPVNAGDFLAIVLRSDAPSPTASSFA